MTYPIFLYSKYSITLLTVLFLMFHLSGINSQTYFQSVSSPTCFNLESPTTYSLYFFGVVNLVFPTSFQFTFLYLFVLSVKTSWHTVRNCRTVTWTFFFFTSILTSDLPLLRPRKYGLPNIRCGFLDLKQDTVRLPLINRKVKFFE